MSEDMQAVMGLIIGGTIGMLFVLVFTVVALKFGWIEKFMNWLDL